MKALSIASDLAARFPDNTDVLELLGRAQTLSGEAASAVRTFEQLLKQRPQDARIQYLLGGAEWQAGDRGAAARSFRRAVELRPDYIEARVALLSVLADDQRYDDAISVSRDLQQDYPGNPVGWRLEGRLQVQARNPDAAVKPLQKAQSLAPDTATVLDLAGVYSRTGDSGKAIDLLRGWTAEHPDDVSSLTRLAMYLQSQDRDAEALPIYQHLYELDQTNVVVLNNLAWILHERDDVRALEIARQAYERAPTRPEVADTYGWVLYNRGSKTQGLNMLQEAHLAYPTQTEIAYHVAVALDGVGRGDEAVNTLRKLLRQYPNAPEAGEAQALMEKLSAGGAG
jgi:putative PEP-CTERM system TPR-repeat lipoprotein